MQNRKLPLLSLLLLLAGCTDSRIPESGLHHEETAIGPIVSTGQVESVALPPDIIAAARASRPLEPCVEIAIRDARGTLDAFARNCIESSDRDRPRPEEGSDIDQANTNLVRIARQRIFASGTPEEAIQTYEDVLQTEMQIHAMYQVGPRHIYLGTNSASRLSAFRNDHENRLLRIWESTMDQDVKKRWDRVKNTRGTWGDTPFAFENGYALLSQNPDDATNGKPLVFSIQTAPWETFSANGHDYVVFRDCVFFEPKSDYKQKIHNSLYIGQIENQTLVGYVRIHPYRIRSVRSLEETNEVLILHSPDEEIIRIPLPLPAPSIPEEITMMGLKQGAHEVAKARNTIPFDPCSADVIRRTRETLQAVTNHWAGPSREKIPFPSVAQIKELHLISFYVKHRSGGENDTMLSEYNEPIPGFTPFPVHYSDEVTATNLERIARCRIRMAKTPEEAVSIYQDVVNTETHAHMLASFHIYYVCMGSGLGLFLCSERIEQECRMLQIWEEAESEGKAELWNRVKNAKGLFKNTFVAFESGFSYTALNPDFNPADEANDDPWISSLSMTPADAFTENGHDYIVFKVCGVVDMSGDTIEYYLGLIENNELVCHVRIGGENCDSGSFYVSNGTLHFKPSSEEEIIVPLPHPPDSSRLR